MRSHRVPLAVLLVLLCGANLAVTFLRSGIPHELRGRVDGFERMVEKHPGLDDVYLVQIEGRTIHLDTELACLFIPGTVVEKPAWGTQMQLRGRPVKLKPSRDFRGMAVVMPLALLLGLALLFVPEGEPLPPLRS